MLWPSSLSTICLEKSDKLQPHIFTNITMHHQVKIAHSSLPSCYKNNTRNLKKKKKTLIKANYCHPQTNR